jgi:hypothetical protein
MIDQIIFTLVLIMPPLGVAIIVLFQLYIYVSWKVDLHADPNTPAPLTAIPNSRILSVGLVFGGASLLPLLWLLNPVPVLWLLLYWIAETALTALGLSVFYSLNSQFPRPSTALPTPPAPPQPGEISEAARRIIDELSKRP